VVENYLRDPKRSTFTSKTLDFPVLINESPRFEYPDRSPFHFAIIKPPK
jgi:hypothetical protein